MKLNVFNPSNLHRMRTLLAKNKIDAFVLFNSDQHQNEFINNQDKNIYFVSNFTGSNAVCLISKQQAVLFTDGRYFNQVFE